MDAQAALRRLEGLEKGAQAAFRALDDGATEPSPAGPSTHPGALLESTNKRRAVGASTSKADPDVEPDDGADGEPEPEEQPYWVKEFACTRPQLADLSLAFGLDLSDEQLDDPQWLLLEAMAKAFAQLPQEHRAALSAEVRESAAMRAKWREALTNLCGGKQADRAELDTAFGLVCELANFTMRLAPMVEQALRLAFPDYRNISSLCDFIVLCIAYDWRSVVTGELLSSADSTTPWPSLFHLLPAKVFAETFDGNMPVYNIDFTTPGQFDKLAAGDPRLLCVSAILGEDECENDRRRPTLSGRSRRRDAPLQSFSQPFNLTKAFRIATGQWFAMNRDEHTQFANCSANARDARRHKRQTHAIVLRMRNGFPRLEPAAPPSLVRTQLRGLAIPLDALSEEEFEYFVAKANAIAPDALAIALATRQVPVPVYHQAQNIAAMLLRPLFGRTGSGQAWEALLATAITHRMMQRSRRYVQQRVGPFAANPLAAAVVHALMAAEQSVKTRVVAAAHGLPC